MRTDAYIPHPALQPYIQAYMHSAIGAAQQRMELDLHPVGHGVLAFILDEKHFLYNTQLNKYYNVRFNFTGQLDHYHHLSTSSASMLYVMFKPYGAFKLLGIPQNLLINECTSISDILSNEINELCHKMEDHVTTPLYVLKLLEDWLIEQLRKNEKLKTAGVAYACSEIMANNGNLTIKDLCNLANMSNRTLEHKFKQQIGLSPKMFSRIIRFNQVNKFLKDTATKDWQELVYKYGYFDQSHFIREFKHFFGYTPSQIHLSNENLAGHLADLELTGNQFSI